MRIEQNLGRCQILAMTFKINPEYCLRDKC